jgi:glycosyltransferase involved in cell wall biosynthesis
MQTDSPFFSVIIPVFNRKDLLEKALVSVFAQTFRSFEVIVIDDNSTDGTLEWLQQLQHDKIRILSNSKTKGACGARNTGIENAKGEWVAFLDSDDWWETTKLEVVVKNILSNKDFGVFYSACYYVSEKGDLNPIPTLGITGNLTKHLGRMNPVRGFSSVVVKKHLLTLVGGFDEEIIARQDVDLYFMLSEHSDFYFIPNLLVYINFGNKDKISYNNYKRLIGWLTVYKKHKSNINLHDRFYHHKRISNLAWHQKRFFLFFQFLPGTIISFVLSIFEKQNKNSNMKETIATCIQILIV